MIRSFTAATVIAVAAVGALLVGLVVWALGSLEAEGALAGRTTMSVVSLPAQTKSHNIDTLTRTAEHNGVALSLIVPNRPESGRASAAWTAFEFTGDIARPAFWPRATERPAAAIESESLSWFYALSGSGAARSAFVADLERAGFAVEQASPSARDVITYFASSAPTGILCAVGLLGLCIAFGAESIRRAPRQRARSLLGWRPATIALREALEMLVLTAVTFGALAAAFFGFLAIRGAGPATWILAASLVLPALALTAPSIALLHGCCSLASAGPLWRRPTSRSGAAIVGVATIVLSCCLVADGQAISAGLTTTADLERQLRAEAARGDDIVLATRGTQSDAEEQQLGALARAELDRRTAQLAGTNLAEHALLVSGADAPGGEHAVLLAPRAIRADAASIVASAKETLAFGWEVDADEGGPAAPRSLRIRTVDVDSTASITEPVDRWTYWDPKDPMWPDVAVLSVPPQDIPANQLATGAANGEVRFRDEAALRAGIADAGLSDLVLAYDRVGAAAEARLAQVLTDRLLLLVALVAGLVAAMLAVVVLAAEHRTRTAAGHRLRSLVGRHPALHHRAFVVRSAALVGVAVGGFVLVADGTPSTRSGLMALALAGTTWVVSALALSAGVLFTHKPRRTLR